MLVLLCFLRCYRFSVNKDPYIDSSTESPVHVLMLSIQAVCGLPRLRASGVVPCIVSCSPCFVNQCNSLHHMNELMVKRGGGAKTIFRTQNANCKLKLIPEFDCVENSFCEVLYPWPGVCLSACLPVDVDVLSKRMNGSNWFWLILHCIFGKFQ